MATDSAYAAFSGGKANSDAFGVGVGVGSGGSSHTTANNAVADSDTEEDFSLFTILNFLVRRKHRYAYTAMSIRIPDTIVYQRNAIRGWYYFDERCQEVIKKDQLFFAPKEIYDAFIPPAKKPKGEKSNAAAAGMSAAAPQNYPKIVDCVAKYMYIRPAVVSSPSSSSLAGENSSGGVLPNESRMVTTVEFLSADDLHNFLFKNTRRYDGILQRFVVPQSMANAVIQVIWSPCVTLLNWRKNMHAINDKRFSLFDRLSTHESDKNSMEVLVHDRMNVRFAKICKSIADRIAVIERRTVSRMIAYFKIDDHDHINFLWASPLLFSVSAAATTSSKQKPTQPQQPQQPISIPRRESAVEMESSRKMSHGQISDITESARGLASARNLFSPMILPLAMDKRRSFREQGSEVPSSEGRPPPSTTSTTAGMLDSSRYNNNYPALRSFLASQQPQQQQPSFAKLLGLAPVVKCTHRRVLLNLSQKFGVVADAQQQDDAARTARNTVRDLKSTITENNDLFGWKHQRYSTYKESTSASKHSSVSVPTTSEKWPVRPVSAAVRRRPTWFGTRYPPARNGTASSLIIDQTISSPRVGERVGRADRPGTSAYGRLVQHRDRVASFRREGKQGLESKYLEQLNATSTGYTSPLPPSLLSKERKGASNEALVNVHLQAGGVGGGGGDCCNDDTTVASLCDVSNVDQYWLQTLQAWDKACSSSSGGSNVCADWEAFSFALEDPASLHYTTSPKAHERTIAFLEDLCYLLYVHSFLEKQLALFTVSIPDEAVCLTSVISALLQRSASATSPLRPSRRSDNHTTTATTTWQQLQQQSQSQSQPLVGCVVRPLESAKSSGNSSSSGTQQQQQQLQLELNLDNVDVMKLFQLLQKFRVFLDNYFQCFQCSCETPSC